MITFERELVPFTNIYFVEMSLKFICDCNVVFIYLLYFLLLKKKEKSGCMNSKK